MKRYRRTGRDERGSAVGQVAIGTICLSVVVATFVLLLQYATAGRQAATAADLAALAGAQALLQGEEPCRSADHVARANHGRLADCTVTWQTVEVRVSVPVALHPGTLPDAMTARALAAPTR